MRPSSRPCPRPLRHDKLKLHQRLPGRRATTSAVERKSPSRTSTCRRWLGTIVRINERTASIDPGDGTKWRVGFALLRHVVDV